MVDAWLINPFQLELFIERRSWVLQISHGMKNFYIYSILILDLNFMTSLFPFMNDKDHWRSREDCLLDYRLQLPFSLFQDWDHNLCSNLLRKLRMTLHEKSKFLSHLKQSSSDKSSTFRVGEQLGLELPGLLAKSKLVMEELSKYYASLLNHFIVWGK